MVGDVSLMNPNFPGHLGNGHLLFGEKGDDSQAHMVGISLDLLFCGYGISSQLFEFFIVRHISNVTKFSKNVNSKSTEEIVSERLFDLVIMNQPNLSVSALEILSFRDK